MGPIAPVDRADGGSPSSRAWARLGANISWILLILLPFCLCTWAGIGAAVFSLPDGTWDDQLRWVMGGQLGLGLLSLIFIAVDLGAVRSRLRAGLYVDELHSPSFDLYSFVVAIVFIASSLFVVGWEVNRAVQGYGIPDEPWHWAYLHVCNPFAWYTIAAWIYYLAKRNQPRTRAPSSATQSPLLAATTSVQDLRWLTYGCVLASWYACITFDFLKKQYRPWQTHQPVDWLFWIASGPVAWIHTHYGWYLIIRNFRRCAGRIRIAAAARGQAVIHRTGLWQLICSTAVAAIFLYWMAVWILHVASGTYLSQGLAFWFAGGLFLVGFVVSFLFAKGGFQKCVCMMEYDTDGGLALTVLPPPYHV